jgi:hypothetical protein
MLSVQLGTLLGVVPQAAQPRGSRGGRRRRRAGARAPRCMRLRAADTASALAPRHWRQGWYNEQVQGRASWLAHTNRPAGCRSVNRLVSTYLSTIQSITVKGAPTRYAARRASQPAAGQPASQSTSQPSSQSTSQPASRRAGGCVVRPPRACPAGQRASDAPAIAANAMTLQVKSESQCGRGMAAPRLPRVLATPCPLSIVESSTAVPLTARCRGRGRRLARLGPRTRRGARGAAPRGREATRSRSGSVRVLDASSESASELPLA